MNDDYEIIFNNIDIIECSTEYNIQSGGYDNLKYNQIIELWQNPDYNNKFLNFYVIVNRYLRGVEIDIKPEWLNILKLHSKMDFTEFMIYYVNKLTNIIYKNPSNKKHNFYRGENRKSFYHEIGDVLFYSTFQSVSSSLSIAYKFAETHKDLVKLLFVLEVPSGSYYKELTTKLKLYNYKKKITTLIDEKEFLIMPNTYYVITDKFTIYNNINVIKIKMIKQDYYQIENNNLYKQQTIYPKSKDIMDFKSLELDKFIKLTQNYKNIINKFNFMILYKLSTQFYNDLNNPNNDNIFNIDMDLINNIVSQINDLNIREKAEEIKRVGLGYYDHEIKKNNDYKKRIDRINLIITAGTILNDTI
jgi:hypothetical protein